MRLAQQEATVFTATRRDRHEHDATRFPEQPAPRHHTSIRAKRRIDRRGPFHSDSCWNKVQTKQSQSSIKKLKQQFSLTFLVFSQHKAISIDPASTWTQPWHERIDCLDQTAIERNLILFLVDGSFRCNWFRYRDGEETPSARASAGHRSERSIHIKITRTYNNGCLWEKNIERRRCIDVSFVGRWSVTGQTHCRGCGAPAVHNNTL